MCSLLLTCVCAPVVLAVVMLWVQEWLMRMKGYEVSVCGGDEGWVKWWSEWERGETSVKAAECAGMSSGVSWRVVYQLLERHDVLVRKWRPNTKGKDAGRVLNRCMWREVSTGSCWRWWVNACGVGSKRRREDYVTFNCMSISSQCWSCSLLEIPASIMGKWGGDVYGFVQRMCEFS